MNKNQFIEFVMQAGVLKLGEFTLKSGRKSPYFFNAGLFNTGGQLANLAQGYARALADSGIDFDVLFGPAPGKPFHVDGMGGVLLCTDGAIVPHHKRLAERLA